MEKFVIRSPKWTQSQPVSTPSALTIYSPLSGRVKVAHNLHSEIHFVSQVTQKSPLAEMTCVSNTNIREKNFYQVFVQRTEQTSGKPGGTPLGNKTNVRCLNSLNSSRNRHSMPSYRSVENLPPDTQPKVSSKKIGELGDYINPGDEEALAADSVRIMHTPPDSIPPPSRPMKLDDLGKVAVGAKPPYKHVPVQQTAVRHTPPHNPVIQRIQRDLNSPSATVRLRALRAMKNPTNSAYAHFDIPLEEQSIITDEERNPPPPPTIQEVMRDVVVYVEVRSGVENRSAGVQKVISALGARVNNRLRKDTTHVIFKDGLLSTYKKAKLWNIPIVSILWVEACKKKLRLCDPLEYQISNVHRYENPELYEKLKPIRAIQLDTEIHRRVRKKVAAPNESTPKANKKTAALNGGATSSAKTQKTDISQYFKLLGSKQTTNQDGKDAIRMSAGLEVNPVNETAIPLTPINHLNAGTCNGKSSEQQDFVFDVFVTPKNTTQAAATNIVCDNDTPRATGVQRPTTRRLSRALEANAKTLRLSQTMETTKNQTLTASSPPKSSGKKRSLRRQTTFTQKSLEISTFSTDREELKKSKNHRRTVFTPQLADETIPQAAKSKSPKVNRRRTLYTPQPLEMSMEATGPVKSAAIVECMAPVERPVSSSLDASTPTAQKRRKLYVPSNGLTTDFVPTVFSSAGATKRRRTMMPLHASDIPVTPNRSEMEISANFSNRRRTLYTPTALAEQLTRTDEPPKTTSRRRTLVPKKPLFDTHNHTPQQKDDTLGMVFERQKPPTPNKKIPKRTKPSNVDSSKTPPNDEAQIALHQPAAEQLSTPAATVTSTKNNRRRTLYTPKPFEVEASAAPTEPSSANPTVVLNQELLESAAMPQPVVVPKVLEEVDKEGERQYAGDSTNTTAQADPKDVMALVDDVEKCLESLNKAPRRRTLLARSASTEQQIYYPTLIELRKSFTTPNLAVLVEEPKRLSSESDKTIIPQSSGSVAEKTNAEEAAPVTTKEDEASVEAAPPVEAAAPVEAPVSSSNATAPVLLDAPKELDAPSTPTAQKKRKLFVPSNCLTPEFFPTAFSSAGVTNRRRSIMPLDAPDTPATPNRSATPKPKRAPRRSTLDFELPKLGDDASSSSTRVVRTPAATLLKNRPDPKLPSLVYTNMPKRQIEVIREAITELGGFRLEKVVNDTTTHIVTLESRRTLNLLRALIRGLWILDYTWIIDSLHAGKWLCEETYELKDFSRAVEICRAERQAFGSYYRCELFSQLGPFYISQHCGPITKENMKELILMCGGKMATSRNTAKFILGNITQMSDDKIYITPYWVLDSVTQMQIKPYRMNAEMVKLMPDGTTKSGHQRSPGKAPH